MFNHFVVSRYASYYVSDSGVSYQIQWEDGVTFSESSGLGYTLLSSGIAF